jgi:ParB/RepB/Spo0J family partition protein
MTTATAPVGAKTTDFRMIGLEQLFESPKNPRKHFDKPKLEELSRSIEQSGVLTPLTVRPRKEGMGYEIAAGHRRRRAALLVVERTGASFDVPCVVRELSDAEFMEILVVENGQREDVHPLEEAQGYFELMQDGIGYDIPKIAERVGRHKDTVYDRLKLLQLIPKAKSLFLENRFTLQHAVILARLSSEWQEKAIAVDDDGYGDGGLFRNERAGRRDLLDELDEDPQNPYDVVKAASVREFQYWVDHTVRFDATEPDVQNLFPETADAVTTAEEAALKVIHITHLYQVPEDARDAEQRTYTERAWERADGKHDSKECEHSVLGVVVVGPGRGESFPVCIAKEKCTVHYADRIREKAKREKAASKNGASSAAANQKTAQDREHERHERERKVAELQRARWKKATPAIREAAADRIRAISIAALADVILEDYASPSNAAAKLIPRGRTADDFLRYIAFGVIEGTIDGAYNVDHAIKELKRLGVDAQKILDREVPIEKAGKGK